jgi:hypothetical protein
MTEKLRQNPPLGLRLRYLQAADHLGAREIQRIACSVEIRLPGILLLVVSASCTMLSSYIERFELH